MKIHLKSFEKECQLLRIVRQNIILIFLLNRQNQRRHLLKSLNKKKKFDLRHKEKPLKKRNKELNNILSLSKNGVNSMRIQQQ